MTGFRVPTALALLLLSLSASSLLVPSAAAYGSCVDGSVRVGEQMVILELSSRSDQFLYDGAHYMPRPDSQDDPQELHDGYTSTFTLTALHGAVTLQVYDAETCQSVSCDAGVDPVSTEGNAASCTVPVGAYLLAVDPYGPFSDDGNRVDYVLTINTA